MITQRFQPAVWLALAGLLLAASCSDSDRLYPNAGRSSAGEAGASSEAGGSSEAGASSGERGEGGGEGGEGGGEGGAGATVSSGGAGPEPGAGCETDGDCGECQICEGRCIAADTCTTTQACEALSDCVDPPGSSSCFTPFCSVDGYCVYARSRTGAKCGDPSSCVDGELTSAETCSELGLCEASTRDCAPYLCDGDGTACTTSCSDETECIPGHRCDADDRCIPLLERGASCAADEQCASGRCDCGAPTCSAESLICVESDCDACRYDPDGSGDCDGFIASGGDDLANTCGDVGCNGAGGCQLGLGVACSSDDSCASGNCECTDVVCSTRSCATLACGTCKYVSGSACANIPDGYQDPAECAGDSSCASGSCVALKPLGAACSSNGECFQTCIFNVCSYRSEDWGSCDDFDSEDCASSPCVYNAGSCGPTPCCWPGTN